MRRLAYLAAAACVAAAPLILAPARAYADPPAQQGWWWQANPGALPEVGVSAAQPPPDVPSNGLLVEGGSGSANGTSDSSPMAFAALVYQLAVDATASTLTLAVAPNSGTTPSVTLELCPLANSAINPEQGGPISDAPTFSCTTNVTAQASSSGNTFQFNVSNLVSGGALAVAVLPTSPTDRVVLSAPDSNSLAVQTAPPTSDTSDTSAPPGQTSPTPDSSPATTASSAGTESVPPSTSAPQAVALTGASPSPLSPAIAATPATVRSTPTLSNSPESASKPSASTFFMPVSKAEGANPIAVVVILVASVIGTAIWLGAGRSAVRAVLKEQQL
jgi:hypothetical protein